MEVCVVEVWLSAAETHCCDVSVEMFGNVQQTEKSDKLDLLLRYSASFCSQLGSKLDSFKQTIDILLTKYENITTWKLINSTEKSDKLDLLLCYNASFY